MADKNIKLKNKDGDILYPQTKVANVTDLDLSVKQDSTDEALETTDKTIVGAINEVKNQVGLDSTISSITGNIRFGVDSNGNYGYIKDGADSVIPFRYLSGNLFDIMPYTESSPYSLTPSSNDTYVYINDVIATVRQGKKYIFSAYTSGTWGTHNTSGTASTYNVTIWLSNSDHTGNWCFGGDNTQTGYKQWEYTANYSGTIYIRFNAYVNGHPTVKFWDVQLRQVLSEWD